MTGFKLCGISKAFGPRKVLRALDLDVPAGSFISLVGASGSGKSTLLRILAGLDNYDQGLLQFEPSSQQQPRCAFVFQEPQLLAWRNVSENVQLPLELQFDQDRQLGQIQDQPTRIQQALSSVHLESAAHLYPHELSGGMKMRASIARALVAEPELLLLDEPFAALDELTRQELQLQLLSLWQERKLTVIFVTHSLAEALFLSEKVFILQDQAVVPAAHLENEPRNQKLRTSPIFNETLAELQKQMAGSSTAQSKSTTINRSDL